MHLYVLPAFCICAMVAGYLMACTEILFFGQKGLMLVKDGETWGERTWNMIQKAKCTEIRKKVAVWMGGLDPKQCRKVWVRDKVGGYRRSSVGVDSMRKVTLEQRNN